MSELSETIGLWEITIVKRQQVFVLIRKSCTYQFRTCRVLVTERIPWMV